MKDINDVFEEDKEITEVELEEVSANTKDIESKGTKEDVVGDYNFVREKLVKSIVRGSELIDESVRAAKIDASPRAIEAASGAVKSLTEASKSLLELHEKIREIEKEKCPEGSTDLEGEKVVLKSTLSDLIRSIEKEDKAQNS